MTQKTAEKTKAKLGMTWLLKKGLGRSLFSWLLIISLMPMIIIGWISSQEAYESIQEDKFIQLSSVAKLKRTNIDYYFNSIEKNLSLQAKLSNTVDFLSELHESFNNSNKKIEGFTKSFRWALVVDKYNEDIKRFISSYNYIDAFIIDLNGNILYTVRQDSDLGTNVNHDETKFSIAFQTALDEGKPIFSDIAHYLPFDGKVASFMMQVVLNDEGEKIGVFAVHISMDPIVDITQSKLGLGETGETYLVGMDLLMRTDSRFIEGESKVLKQRVDTEQTQNWLNHMEMVESNSDNERNNNHLSSDSSHDVENIGTKPWIYADYKNNEVLGTHEMLNVSGVPMVMIAEIRYSEVFYRADFLVNLVFLIVSITAFLVLILAVIITKKIVGPITLLSSWASQVAEGDLKMQDLDIPNNEIGTLNRSFIRVVDSFQLITDITKSIAIGDLSKKAEVRSENDELSNSINQMISNIKETVDQANTIAKGDYSAEIVPRSVQDELSISLDKMTKNLHSVSAENERTQWISSGQNLLSESMRGDQDLNHLATNIITMLSKFLNAAVGAIYLVSNDDKEIKLVGSYSYTHRSSMKNGFLFGEGLIGQAALEKKHIILTTVPQDYMKLQSGLGKTTPKMIIVLPFMYEGKVKGVLEFGFLAEIDDKTLGFLDSISDHIGIGVNSSESRNKLSKVLDQAKTQASELQEQQSKLQTSNQELEEYAKNLKKSEEEFKIQSEELRATNEGLSVQTESLRKSQEELKQQSEELRASNEELEEKSEYLIRQKNEIEKKNEAINKSKSELEGRAEDLARASKYKSEFLSNMSHELRTPLNSLLILAQNLSENDEGNLSADQVESAEIIQSSGKDLLMLINDILDLSKIEAGKMTVNLENISINDLIVDIKRDFQHVAEERDLNFEIVQEEGISANITTDLQRIKQVLRNLLSNAFKFTSKGTVTFSIHRVPNNHVFVNQKINAHRCLAFSVSDTGIGIPEESQKAIFEAFQQADGSTSRLFGGTGLGLAISSAFIQLLEGEISVSSISGQGSTFTVFIPSTNDVVTTGKVSSSKSNDVPRNNSYSHTYDEKYTSTALKKDVSQSTSQSNHGSKIIEEMKNELLSNSPPIKPFIPDDRDGLHKNDQCILIIEDDKVFAKVLMGLAHRRRYKCVAAGDGRSGMLLAHNIKPMAILLDLGLPDIDGLEVLDYLKNDLELRHIPVHILSGREDQVAALQKGAMGFVPKPASVDVISEVFSEIEALSNKTVKDLLIVDDDENTRISLMKLLENDNTRISSTASGIEAFKLISEQNFDCVVLDIRLPDINGDELLVKLDNELEKAMPPVVVFTGKDLSTQEYNALQRHTSSIVVKGAESMERVLDETTLFLHSLEAKMPEKQKSLIQHMHEPDQGLKDKKVLLVDDDLRNTFALSKVLKKHGLEVIIADNGQLALEKLIEVEEIDIVLMDIMMPIMDGYEAMKSIRSQSAFVHLPIIALTANAMPEDRTACLDAGANDYLTKPIDKDKLLALMRIWLSGQQPSAVN